MPKGKERDMQILRLAIIAELDASNLYEKLAQLAQNGKVTKVLLDISREEKVHVGEFEEMLEMVDPEHEKQPMKAKKKPKN
jgi:rubrerythrin